MAWLECGAGSSKIGWIHHKRQAEEGWRGTFDFNINKGKCSAEQSSHTDTEKEKSFLVTVVLNKPGGAQGRKMAGRR